MYRCHRFDRYLHVWVVLITTCMDPDQASRVENTCRYGFSSQWIRSVLSLDVGFVDSNNTPRNYQQLYMQAISHCLDGGTFVRSQAGSHLVPDFNNLHLPSWLFPHLDPWCIGGFHEPCRLRLISLEQQLKYLLSVDSSPSFHDDPNFAFM